MLVGNLGPGARIVGSTRLRLSRTCREPFGAVIHAWMTSDRERSLAAIRSSRKSPADYWEHRGISPLMEERPQEPDDNGRRAWISQPCRGAQQAAAPACSGARADHWRI